MRAIEESAALFGFGSGLSAFAAPPPPDVGVLPCRARTSSVGLALSSAAYACRSAIPAMCCSSAGSGAFFPDLPTRGRHGSRSHWWSGNFDRIRYAIISETGRVMSFYAGTLLVLGNADRVAPSTADVANAAHVAISSRRFSSRSPHR
jgi:hypothetical protein